MIVRELIARLGLDFDQSAFDKGERAMRTMRNVAVGLAGVFVTGKIAQGLKSIVVGTAEAVDGMSEAAQRVGVTTQALQQLGHAAQVTGSSQEDMGQSLAFLSRNAVEA